MVWHINTFLSSIDHICFKFQFLEIGHVNRAYDQNKRMNEYNGISATKIVQIYKHTFFKILLTG